MEEGSWGTGWVPAARDEAAWASRAHNGQRLCICRERQPAARTSSTAALKVLKALADNTHSVPTLCPQTTCSYVRFLLEALRGKELFRWVELSPATWHHAYMYRDPYNWVGLESEGAAAEWRRVAGGAGGAAEGEEEAEGAGEGVEGEPVVK